jgi:small subunit ribosomal protein S2
LFTSKDGNDIFDLEQSASLIEAAAAVVNEAGKNGKNIVFVGTKDEVSRIVKDTAESLEMAYVTNRWIGGMITNWSEIKKRILRLESLKNEQESGELDRKYTKKERVMIQREIDKLNYNFAGIKNLPKTPDLMVVVDPRHDFIAVQEANDMRIPVIALMSSDCDAKKITHPVWVNDALQSSVSVVLGELAKAFAEGKTQFVPKPVAPRSPSTTSSDSRPRRPRPTA